MADPAKTLADRVGHPEVLKQDLFSRVQDRAVRKFSDISRDWVELMWSLDSFRTARLIPPGMGRSGANAFEGFYRSKGNWFGFLINLLLENQTGLRVGSRTRVAGFSQTHQIDIAWPAREIDPLVCVETKVTGAPATGSTPARGAMSDWSNRRKELKFAATDLKLARREQETSIDHWNAWREKAPPKCFFLWAARLDASMRESIEKMADESQTLVNTYLDGAGVLAWSGNSGSDGYEVVTVPTRSRVTDLDDVLYRVSSEIKDLAGEDGTAPPPVD